MRRYALALIIGVAVIALSFLSGKGGATNKHFFWIVGALFLFVAWRTFARARRKWRQGHDTAL